MWWDVIDRMTFCDLFIMQLKELIDVYESVRVIPGQIVWMEKRFLSATRSTQLAEGVQSPAARVSQVHTHTHTISYLNINTYINNKLFI